MEITMSDLTDADLEAMLKWREAGGGWLEPDDIPALIAALREARAERDTMAELYAREGHKSLVLLNENTSLLAENRLLREELEHDERLLTALDELPTTTGHVRLVLSDMVPLTAAEVARVKRLEAFAEWVAAGEPSLAEYDPSDGYGILTVYYNMAQKAKAALAAFNLEKEK